MLIVPLLLLLAGCGGHDAAVPMPLPTNPVASGFTGRLLVVASQKSGTSGVYELTFGSTAAFGIKRLLDTEDATVSHDGSKVLHAQDQALVIRDLASGRVARLGVDGPLRCGAWSPDDKHVVVRRNVTDLVVAGLDGSIVKLATEDRELYSPADGSGGHWPVVGELSCANWLSNDTLVFQRRKALPKTVTLPPNTIEVPADTTTVAVLSGGRARLTDAAKRWRLMDRCGDRLLTSDVDKVTYHLSTPSGPAGEGPHIVAENAAFLPGTCQLAVSDGTGVRLAGAGQPVIVDSRGHALVLPNDVHSGAAVWSLAPGRVQVADPSGDEMFVLDLKSGREMRLETEDGFLTEKAIAWLS